MIEFILIVGIRGRVLSLQVDVQLNDVVIGYSNLQYGRVVQYNFGKIRLGRYLTQIEFLNALPTILLSALAKFQSNYLISYSSLSIYLSRLISY